MKKIFAVLTAAALTLLLANPMFEADEISEQDTYDVQYEAEYPTGDAILPEGTEIAGEELEAVLETAELNEAAVSASRPKRAPAKTTYKYSSDYYYNNITSDKAKQIHEEIVNMLNNTLNSSADLTVTESSNGTSMCSLGYIECGGEFTSDEVWKIVRSVYYSNPQFFFFQGVYSYSCNSQGNVTYIFPLIITDFADGAKRTEYKNKINDLTNEWVPQIAACETNVEKEMMIAKLLAKQIKYIKQGYHQTIAGALVDGECVCNGYAMAMAYFCNIFDMDCFLAVSQGHAWNFIDVDGTGRYCEVDVTWMDNSSNLYSYVNVYWFNKSHDTFMERDSNGSHIYEEPTHNEAGILRLPASYDYIERCPDSEHVSSKLSKTFGTIATPCMEDYQYIPACPVCYYAETYYSNSAKKPHDYAHGSYETTPKTHTAYCAYGCGNHDEAKVHSYTNGVCTVCGYIHGDVNKDRTVDNSDMTALIEYLSDETNKYNPAYAYDINGDGYADNIDVLELKAILAAAD